MSNSLFRNAVSWAKARLYQTRAADVLFANTTFFLILFVVASWLILPHIWSLYIQNPVETKANILAELTGFLFDVLLFGLLLTLFEHVKGRRDKVARYHEELDDYRGWDGDESAYRNAGIVRRLNKLGEVNLPLYGSNLCDTHLPDVNLKGSSLFRANLWKAYCPEGNFENTDLHGTNFAVANLEGASFVGAKVGSIMNSTDTNFRNAKLSFADMRKVKGLTVEHVCSAEMLLDIQLDDNLREAALRVCPEKFEWPEDLKRDVDELEKLVSR